MTGRQALRAVALLAATAAWTGLALPALAVGAFVAADTSCDGGEHRADPDGVWWVVLTVAVWASPFLVVALRTRSWLAVTVGLVVIALATAVVVWTIASPGEFCF
ncbi:hypothetical protein [uncultured Williamsia sp.]|uniref:hypothetical protein n=1 Tax=uncultured Williamsia sp. TaxID=259311 RepID=UPI002612CF03|nr:hypothetical protein [uncultured Williamsia sp.]